MITLPRFLVSITSLTLLISLTLGQKPAVSKAQRSNKDSVIGKWQGVFKQGERSMDFTMELKTAGNKIVGQIKSARGEIVLSSGTYGGGKLIVALKNAGGETGKLIGVIKDGKLSGDWNIGNGNGTFECAKAADEKAADGADKKQGAK